MRSVGKQATEALVKLNIQASIELRMLRQSGSNAARARIAVHYSFLAHAIDSLSDEVSHLVTSTYLSQDSIGALRHQLAELSKELGALTAVFGMLDPRLKDGQLRQKINSPALCFLNELSGFTDIETVIRRFPKSTLLDSPSLQKRLADVVRKVRQTLFYCIDWTGDVFVEARSDETGLNN
jgi:hypothetical protein